jgi:hypothetical protein
LDCKALIPRVLTSLFTCCFSSLSFPQRPTGITSSLAGPIFAPFPWKVGKCAAARKRATGQRGLCSVASFVESQPTTYTPTSKSANSYCNAATIDTTYKKPCAQPAKALKGLAVICINLKIENLSTEWNRLGWLRCACRRGADCSDNLVMCTSTM